MGPRARDQSATTPTPLQNAIRFWILPEVVEVGPRDGLQSLERVYPTEVKLPVIVLLAGAGLTRIEVAAFVRSDVVPQLADADELTRRLPRDGRCSYRALVPNRRGAEHAAAAGVDEILALVTASETYTSKP